MPNLQKIIPCLWFDYQAEEAATFYVTIFKNAKLGKVTWYNQASAKASGKPAGSVMTVEFEIEGQRFVALNGGTYFKINEAVSFMVSCETQDEIDYFWEKLSEGGDPDAQQCGWLKDKYGVSWQIVPTILDEMLTDPDQEKTERVTNAFLQMKKFDIATLELAYAGE